MREGVDHTHASRRTLRRVGEFDTVVVVVRSVARGWTFFSFRSRASLEPKMADANSTAMFRALSTGASFDGSRFRAAVKVFSNAAATAPKTAPSPNDKERGTPSSESVGTTAAKQHLSAATLPSLLSATAVPPVATVSTIDDFLAHPRDNLADKKKKTHSGGEDGADGQPANERQHNPIQLVNPKRAANLRKRFELQVSGGMDVPPPFEHFSQLVRPPYSVPSYLVDNLFEREHRKPTPVQMQVIPCLLKRRDVIACAPTGSGKTIAFLLPMLAILGQPNPTSAGVRAIVTTPTKELAVQIEKEALFLTKNTAGHHWKLVAHGQSLKGKDIFVTTPARATALLATGDLKLDHVEIAVFDEGDQLYEAEGFVKHMDTILAACTNPNKTVAVFSATLSPQAEKLVRSVMHDAVRVIVRGRRNASTHVTQRLIYVGNEMGKVIAVRNLLKEGLQLPALIFVQTIERTKELADEIRVAGLPLAIMNSKMTAEERDETVRRFRLGRIWVLVCTEVLARGIDFKNVGTVINFDIPLTLEAYVHRVGRTGRADETGVALTFFTDDDKPRLPAIARLVAESGSPVDPWMLELKAPDKKRRRQLSRTAPTRAVVSTEKRVMIRKQRFERDARRAAGGKGGAKDAAPHGPTAADLDDDDRDE